jgi:dihydroxyacid dehydratase/phosphogluconate dehydratase
MDARAFDNCKLPSRHVTEAPSHAPHRAHAISRVPQTMCALGHGSAGNADWLAMPRRAVTSTPENVKFDWDQEVVCAFADPISAMGDVVGWQCSRARQGAIVEVAAMTRLQLRGPAHGFDVEECHSDGWSWGSTRHLCVGEVGRAAPMEAPVEGAIALAIDAHQSTFDLHASEADFALRRMAGKAPPNPEQSGTLANYADRVGHMGPVARGGSRAEVVGYADI